MASNARRIPGFSARFGRACIEHGRFAIAYLLFVVLPALGVLEMLELGRSLQAPPALRGTWSVEVQGSFSRALQCLPAHTGAETLGLTIVQSGRRLELAIAPANAGAGGKLRLRGELRRVAPGAGERIHATGASAGATGAARALQLSAEPEASSARLTGRIDFIGCSEQLALPFIAARSPRAPGPPRPEEFDFGPGLSRTELSGPSGRSTASGMSASLNGVGALGGAAVPRPPACVSAHESGSTRATSRFE